ncbi:Crp/Fnr family transcriptional regulator [Winogradskyella sp.]|uniref:Crp/Fnr family transcriptional regulator n=1 Tax=Winogradskyella sp. TaxID=1883156 RepID=UPI003F69BEDC
MIEKNILEKFDYLFDKELIDILAKKASLHRFNKGDIIIDLGQNIKFVPLIIEGNIKVLSEDNRGHELLLYLLESGDTCAMSLTCCMSKNISKIRAIAEQDVVLASIPKEDMEELFNTNKNWRNYILQSYQFRFNEMLEAIDTLAFMQMDERLFKYLTDQVKLTADTNLQITHQEIAEDLHTSRVVVSRLLKKLEKENKIELGRNKIRVIDF